MGNKQCKNCIHQSVCIMKGAFKPFKCTENLDINGLLRDIAELEKERDYWHNLCSSYEQTMVKMAEAIAKRDGA